MQNADMLADTAACCKNTVVFTFTQQNRDEGKCPQNGVKWKDLMSTLIMDRLEASFGNCRDDELPQTMARTTQNMTNNCDECQQCNTSGGESSSTKYFDSAWNDDTCYQHSTTDHDSVACTSLLNGCSTDGFLNGNNSCCRSNMKPQLYPNQSQKKLKKMKLQTYSNKWRFLENE
ncbi:hypothetical protein AGLY_011257 [Aphis glycines]|uniref:Uncharacterized protein n=1 Tax=Aphis glycines TaxID=307491 RepID=A0A6G0TDU4_APHGL|nr:hypothetical protein AGLY_011257 [Aphis glycines]